MKLFYKLAGCVTIIGCFFFIRFNYEDIKTYQSGYFIDVKIITVPNCITTKTQHFIKFEYKGKIHPKAIGVLTCRELKEGETIIMKTNMDNSIFLYEYENPYNDLFYIIFILLFGVLLIYMGFKK